ncbi:MAG: Ig-like domain-containing protein [Bifidobacterium tibiigranuli]|uniref:Ig-like domain-containing protein n=1 Tax=Bifidobacterium tibiigranuli TaxID=2172043 RepID=UPI0026ED63B1|nr:Ig-like domain-containing protein [Bifidobacterium tibiigranuli]MCI1672790.1 Ig-like domain-containing protein [Bifidobacterium tibiigranuli]MCI1713629.1 Ig-like domain-containing protein [Bifidobacterium tibiigranuli]
MGHYEITANATVSAGADGANGVSASSLPTWGGSVLGNTIDGNEYYAGTQGDPALYQMDSDSTLLDHGNAQRDTVKLDGIKLVDKSTGLQISDHFSIIMADAESTGTGEGFTFSSDKPLNELMKVVPQGWDQPCTQTYDGLGTNQVTCVSKANQTTGGRGIAMVGANAPSTAQASFVNDKQGSHSREGVAFAVLFTNIAVPGTQVNQAQDANGNPVTDATFTTKAVRGTPGEGAELGESSSNGAVNTSSNPFMIGTDYVTYSVAKSSGNTPEGAYSVKWDCSLNGDPVSNADLQPSADGRTVKLMTPQPTEDFGTTTSACTATLTAEPPTTGPGEKTVNPTDQPIDLGDLQTAKGNAPEAAPVTQAAFVENGTDTLKTDLGVWKLQVVDGKAVATFTPKDDTVTGEIPPVKYTVTDGNGLQSAQAQLKVTINQPPTTDNASQTINPNDTATLNPASTKGTGDIADVKLVAPADPSKGSLSPDGKTLTVPGEGVWTIALQDGKVVSTFKPETDYHGPVTEQQYVVTDSNNLPSNEGKLDVTINVPPTTGDASKTINPNETATLKPESTKGTGDITDVAFADPAATDGGKTLTVPGQGTWTIGLQDGKVVSTFKPETDYHGDVTDQKYKVTDSNKLASNEGTLSIDINQPPTTGDDSQAINPNEKATLKPASTKGTGDITDVKFADGSTTKTVDGEGTWTIGLDNGQPVATFTPVKDYTGPVTEQQYKVTDKNGLSSNAGKLDVTINQPPTTGDDSQTINPNAVATLNPVSTKGTGDITDVKFADGSTTKTVDGQGTWTIALQDGKVVSTFTPVKDYTGKVDSQQYAVTDSNNLPSNKGTLDVTINQPPTTGDDSQTINPNAVATLNPVSTKGTGDITDVKFADGSTTKTVDGQGTWTIALQDGKVVSTFTPVKDYTGKVDSQQYAVTDSNNLPSNKGTLNVTINQPPTTGDAAKTINPNETATLTPKTVPGSSPIKSVVFDNGKTTKDIPGQGTWSVKLVKGQPVATFTPIKDYDGKVDSQPYTVTDGNGLPATGKLDVTINTPPTTGDDSKVINPNETAKLAPVTKPGSGDITAVAFDNGKDTKTVDGQGTWTVKLVDGQPAAEFAPVKDYTGKVDSQQYTVTDANKLTATGTLNVTINTPPTTGDASATTNPETPVTLNPVTTPGSAPIKSVAFDNGKPSKDVPNEGTWTVTLDDKGQPVATFTPVKGFTGKTTEQPYTVTDGNGLTATGKLDVTVNTPPTTGDSTKTVEPGAAATFAPADLSTKSGSNKELSYTLLDPATGKSVASYTDAHGGVWTINPTTGEATYAASKDYRGPVDSVAYRVTDGNGLTADGKLNIIVPPAASDQTLSGDRGEAVTFDPKADLVTTGSNPDVTISLKTPDANDPNTKTISGKGKWTLDPTTGKITFTPDGDYAGPVPSADYVATDTANKLSATGQLNVIYPPAAGDSQKVIQPGDTAAFGPSDLSVKPGSGDIVSYTLIDPKTDKPVAAYTDAHGGVWTIDPKSGATTYKSNPDYRGPVDPIKYQTTDVNGKTAEGTLSILIPPAAGDQSKTVNPGQSASFDPKADLVTPGTNPSTTTSFTDPDSKSPNTKTVPGEGKWTLDPKTGKITFTPEPGFTKDPTPINYRVTDEKNNLTDTGTLTVHVNQPPTAGDKTVTVNPGNPATLDPVITPGTSKDVNVSFKDHDSNDPAKKTVPGEGVWTIDPKTGKSTFTPEPGFTKDPTPVHYVVTDGNKLTGDGTLTVHVNQPPTAKPQGKETKPGESVEFDPIKNLVKPGTSTDLKITLLEPKTGKPVDGNTVSVPGVGTWTVDPNTGKVTFAPAPGYHGTIQIGYRVTDGNGLSADSTLSVKVPAAPVTPAAPGKPAPSAPAKPAPAAPAKPAPAKQPQSALATTGASVGIALLAMVALAAAGLGLRKLSRRNGSD